MVLLGAGRGAESALPCEIARVFGLVQTLASVEKGCASGRGNSCTLSRHIDGRACPTDPLNNVGGKEVRMAEIRTNPIVSWYVSGAPVAYRELE